MNPKLFDESVKRLFNAFAAIRNEEECGAFLDDLCTISEIKSMAQRLEVARLLKAGESYSEIAEKTGASTATISRVSRCLNYGNDGYTVILGRLGD